MIKYSPEFKSSMLKQLLPPDSLSMKELSDKGAIPISTLYTWRRAKINNGVPMPSSKKKAPDKWTAEQKLAVVVESYTLNAENLNEYCRRNGLYPEQIASWKAACLTGYANDAKNKNLSSDKLKQSKKKIKSLEKELHRKEKALAETAALLTLGKKYDDFWSEKEES